ncbi:MAG: hypothetical protein ABI221_01785 [Candidatus Saccharimonadales bacterium]
MFVDRYYLTEDLAAKLSSQAGNPDIEPSVFNVLRSTFDGMAIIDKQTPDIGQAKLEIGELIATRRAELDSLLSTDQNQPR